METRDEFECVLTGTSKLEAYIGRKDEEVVIEVVISEPLAEERSVCLGVEDARELAKTLDDLAGRLERHLAKGK